MGGGAQVLGIPKSKVRLKLLNNFIPKINMDKPENYYLKQTTEKKLDQNKMLPHTVLMV